MASSIRRAASDRPPLNHRRPPAASTSPCNHRISGYPLYFRRRGLNSSPDRESVASSAKSSSSSVFMMIQDWAPSCFHRVGGKKKEIVSDDDAVVVRSSNGVNNYSRKPLRESKMAPVNAVASVREVKVPKVVSSFGGDDVWMERDYVWAHKYRPRFLREFICNRAEVDELEEMVKKEECSHFIFEGPKGVGKKSMASAFLRDALGLEKLKTKNELRCIELKGEHVPSIVVNLRASTHHVEVNLSELGGHEKHVIVALINESNQPSGKTVKCDYSNCRAIVLHEADCLSSDSQQYLSWIMEKYKGCNKIYFCCSDASKLQTIKHLCKIVKLQQPSDTEIVKVLELIAKQEDVELPRHLAEKIAKNSKNNLRQAIRSFEASWKSNSTLKDDDDILTGWEEDIANISKSIVKEQSPRQLYMIRGKLKNLIEHYVSPDFIFSNLVVELKKLLPEQFHEKIDTMYKEYNIGDTGPESFPPHLQAQVDSAAKFNDQRKNIQYFMKIEVAEEKERHLLKEGKRNFIRDVWKDLRHLKSTELFGNLFLMIAYRFLIFKAA